MNIKDIVKYTAIVAGLSSSTCAYADGNEPRPDHDHLKANHQEARQSALEYLIKENNNRPVKPASSARFKTVEEAVLHLRGQL